MDQKKIGSFIAARRKDNGLTQNQLAEMLGITDKAVSKWETGKSTLLNMIATIDKATSGQIEIDGYDIAELSENDLASFRREHLGFIFQEYNLLDTLTVYENIALALTIKWIPKETIKQTIINLADKLGISEILNKFPYEISGGQRQRCACVRAIAANPSLILADEPTGALESHSATQLLETFVMLCQKYAATILMVTHDALSASYCDKILFMREKQRNQPLGIGKKSFWGWMLIISFFVYLALLSGISFMPDKIMSVSISLISLPMLVCVFSFYRWLYAFIASLRLSQADTFYQGNRLYQIAAITSGSKASANVNTIFCICFIFSAAAFVFGIFLLNPDICIFEQREQLWMGFLQICICIIFMILYFSVFSLLHIMDLKRENKNIRLLFHLGKQQSDLKYLICTQVLIKLFMPILMSFIILWTATPFVNYKMNSILHIHNHLFKAIGSFLACFFALYLCYFGVVYMISTRYVKCSTK